MTSLDTELRADALAILEEFGRTMDFEDAPEPGDYDPDTGDVSFTPGTYPGVQTSPPFDYDQRYVDGDVIRRNDARVFIAAREAEAQSLVPVRGMAVTFDSTRWKVIEVKPLHSGEQVAAYELQIRRG